MKSYTESVALLNSMSKVLAADTTNTALLAQLWNDSVRAMCSIRGGKLRFLEDTKDIATVASQRAYDVPARFRKIIDLYVTVGTTVYRPTPIYNPEEWNDILAMNLGESDVPMFYYVRGRKFDMAPIPASTDGTITVRGRLTIADQSVADASVTVTALTNGAKAVTVSSGALVTMAGKFLRITASATGAAAKGDGYWYEIASATPTTDIVLVAPYQGVTLAAASAAATVGQMTPIPEAYDMGPIYRALALFTAINTPLDTTSINKWWRLYDGGQEAGLVALPGGLVGQMLEAEGETTEGAYISPNATSRLWENAPYYYPRQDASGF